ncbi:hypothetical protein CRUP_026214 [Coryphaenoides rupestris]|nr:hypothetical protein CRUP_026214 [Coryphaenoides rupestris]
MSTREYNWNAPRYLGAPMARHVVAKTHVTRKRPQRRKMAATGDEAAAMDSISRVAMAHPTALNLTATTTTTTTTTAAAAAAQGDGLENALGAIVPIAPKKPSTNSDGGVETAEEAVEPAEPNIDELLKYMEMKDISINISRNLQDLNNKYASLQPYLDQINQIEEQVSSLEQAAYKLDAYSKKLEAKFKKLEKR